jgi:glycerol dehydrogenase
MSSSAPYSPQSVFSRGDGPGRAEPRVLIAPARYVQGDGVLDQLGRYLPLIPSQHPAILLSKGGRRREGQRLSASLSTAQIDCQMVEFQGECSVEEVERVVGLLQAAARRVDCVVAVGGGKCVDAGKCVAYRLGVPVAVCPTLASNDAPCSALSVMYRPDGVFCGVEFFPMSPALVAVDTRIVAQAEARYLAAGMGDAMATWYEARTCLENPRARTVLGARPTMAASALGELCANTLFADGAAAMEAVRASEITDALERIVEANTLLSGIGFESGGLAVAHAVAQGLTAAPVVHKHCLHGEMVAIGLLTQLVLESRWDEAQRVAEFFAVVGLPVHLGQILLSRDDAAELEAVTHAAMMVPFAANEPFEVSAEILLPGLLRGDELGREVAARAGDEAYRALRAK